MADTRDLKIEEKDLLGGDSQPDRGQRIRGMALAVGAAILGVIVVTGLSVVVWKAVGINPGIVERAKLTHKPALDKREYEYAKFSNGLEVVSVYDAQTVSSGFSVAVEAGSFFDPKALPGLAHFCEHMLFLGTEKYPDATGFDNYLQMHGGYNNAYTSEEKTVYYAQLDKAGFQDGLDRFADFFRAPMFDRNYVGKEVHAIDSEHSKNKQSPTWRTMRILNSMAVQTSSVNSFSTGNLETLSQFAELEGYDTVEQLKKYYKTNYCPPRMKLVTFGQQSTGDQINLAFEKFSDIISPEECSAKAPTFAKPEPYPAENLHKFVHIQGVTPQGQLWLMFNMPDLTGEYKKHPAAYLKYVIGYSGENALEHVLKEELGLATGVSVDADSTSAGTKFFVVFDLTPQGRQEYRKVLATFFYYIAFMQRHGIDGGLFKSIGKIRELQWNWAEQSEITDTVMGMSEGLTRMPKEDLLTGDSLIASYDTKQVQKLLDLIKPRNMIAAFVDPDFDASRLKVTDPTLQDNSAIQIDPYYEAKYSVTSLTKAAGVYCAEEDENGKCLKVGENKDIVKWWGTWASEKKKWEKITKQYAQTMFGNENATVHRFQHPLVIKNIPKDINLKFATAPQGGNAISAIYGEEPQMKGNVRETSWYRQGSMAQSPKVNLKFLFRGKAPEKDEVVSAEQALKYQVFQTMLSDQMAPKTVDLRATGISYGFDASPNSMAFTFSGFKNNLKDMVDKARKGVVDGLEKNEPRFQRVVQDLKESLQDYSGMPISYAMKDLKLLTSKNGLSNQELLEALDKITLEGVREEFTALQQKNFQVTALAMGNIAEKEFDDLQKDLTKGLGLGIELPVDKVEKIAPVVKPGHRVEIRKKNPRAGDPNHVTTVTIQVGVPTIEESVIFGILNQVLRPAAYDELRTNQQLGYVVQGGISMNSNVLQVGVMVQGTQKLPDEIEPQIDMVLNKIMVDKLKDMTWEQFDSFKASYAKQLLEPPLGFSDEVEHYWPVVARNGECPDKQLKLLDYLNNQLKDKNQLLAAWNKVIKAKEPRSKFVVKYFSDTLGKIKDVPDFAVYHSQLRKMGVSREAIHLLKQEYEGASVVNKVDSKARKDLFGHGASYWPQQINCGSSATSFLQTESETTHAVSSRKKGKLTQESLQLD